MDVNCSYRPKIYPLKNINTSSVPSFKGACPWISRVLILVNMGGSGCVCKRHFDSQVSLVRQITINVIEKT